MGSERYGKRCDLCAGHGRINNPAWRSHDNPMRNDITVLCPACLGTGRVEREEGEGNG